MNTFVWSIMHSLFSSEDVHILAREWLESLSSRKRGREREREREREIVMIHTLISLSTSWPGLKPPLPIVSNLVMVLTQISFCALAMVVQMDRKSAFARSTDNMLQTEQRDAWYRVLRLIVFFRENYFQRCFLWCIHSWIHNQDVSNRIFMTYTSLWRHSEPAGCHRWHPGIWRSRSRPPTQWWCTTWMMRITYTTGLHPYLVVTRLDTILSQDMDSRAHQSHATHSRV